MKNALVIHPRMAAFGGGELLCLHTIRALQEVNYRVTLFCDFIDLQRIETQFGMADTARRCRHVPLFTGDSTAFLGDSASPSFPTLNALRRIQYLKKTIPRLKREQPDIVFQTQPSVHFLPRTQTFEFMYRPMDIETSDFYHM